MPTAILPIIVLLDGGNARQAAALSLIATLGTLLASAVHPLAGWACGRTQTRFGRRRTYVLLGGAGSVLSIAWIALGHGFAELLGGVLCLKLCYYTALATTTSASRLPCVSRSPAYTRYGGGSTGRRSAGSAAAWRLGPPGTAHGATAGPRDSPNSTCWRRCCRPKGGS